MTDMMRLMMTMLQGQQAAGSGLIDGGGNNMLAGGGCGVMGGGCTDLVAADSSGMPTGCGNAPPRKNMPEGSWICLACHNVNFPNRDVCNKRVCGKSRALCDGGPPPGTSIASNAAHLPPPEGSWACLHCGNTNWPLRTTCNTKTCSQPRDSIPSLPGPPGFA